MQSSQSPIKTFFSRLGLWLLGRPWSTLLAMILLGAAALHYTLGHLSIDTDTTQLIDPDAPFQQFSRKYEQAFSQDLHTLLLVVESDTPELSQVASKRLLRLLEADKEHFNSAYIADDHPFFRDNGLLYLDLEQLQQLSNNLAQAQPFIGRISQQANLSGLLSIVTDALNNSEQAEQTGFDLTTLLDKLAANLEKALNDGTSLLSWRSLLDQHDTRPMQGFIIVSPKLDYSQIRPAQAAIHAVRKAVAAIQDPSLPAVKVWVSGEIGLEDDELAGVSTGTFTASVFSVALVVVILAMAYRSLWLTASTLITLSFGMVFCGAFAAVAVGKLNLISLAFAVSNIGLGVEYAIHFCLRYRDNLGMHINKNLALRGTLTSTAPSLMMAAGTTSIGLYAFIPTDYQGVAELGLLAGTSLFICLATTFVVLPALLKIVPAPTPAETGETPRRSRPWQDALGRMPLRHANTIATATLILAVVSIALSFQVKTDFNPINLRDPNTESVIAFKNLMKNKDTTPMTLSVLANNERDAKALQQRLASLASVDKTVSLFDFQPDNQEEKLALIEDMALTLGLQTRRFPSLIADADPLPAIERLIASLAAEARSSSDNRRRQAMLNLEHQLRDLLLELELRQTSSRTLLIDRIQTALLWTLPGVMNDLFAGLSAQNVTVADLPAEIRDKWLSKEGWYRIQIYPKHDLNELDHLRQFIGEVQTVAPETTDLPIMYWESMKEVVGAFQQAIAIALITIAMLTYFIRRNLVDTVLVITPLILAGLFTMASTVITATPIDFANIIALPLLMGLGVDNGIHMLEKLRHSQVETQNIYQSSTARAMYYGALTTISSFAGLAFSPHQGIAGMGLIITIGIFWIMLCTFVILPAISKLVFKRRQPS